MIMMIMMMLKRMTLLGSKYDIYDDIFFQGTSDLQLERINVYYNEATGGKYVPRYCFMLYMMIIFDIIDIFDGNNHHIYNDQIMIWSQSPPGLSLLTSSQEPWTLSGVDLMAK